MSLRKAETGSPPGFCTVAVAREDVEDGEAVRIWNPQCCTIFCCTFCEAARMSRVVSGTTSIVGSVSLISVSIPPAIAPRR
jgi:hypothetical protein